MDRLTRLPAEIQEKIIIALYSMRDASALACTSSHWNRTVRSVQAREFALSLKAFHRSIAEFDAENVTDVPAVDENAGIPSPQSSSPHQRRSISPVRGYTAATNSEDRLHVACALDAMVEVDMPCGPIFVSLRRAFQQRVADIPQHWRWTFCMFPEPSPLNPTESAGGWIERVHSPAEAVCTAVYRAGREWPKTAVASTGAPTACTTEPKTEETATPTASASNAPTAAPLSPPATTTTTITTPKPVQSLMARRVTKREGGSDAHPFDARSFARALHALITDTRIGRNEVAIGLNLSSDRLARIRRVHVGASHLGVLPTALAEAKAGRGVRILTRRKGRAMGGDEDPVASSLLAETPLGHAFVNWKESALAGSGNHDQPMTTSRFVVHKLRSGGDADIDSDPCASMDGRFGRLVGAYDSAGDAFCALVRTLDKGPHTVDAREYKTFTRALCRAWRNYNTLHLMHGISDDESPEALAMQWDTYARRLSFSTVPDDANQTQLILRLDALASGNNATTTAFVRIATARIPDCNCPRVNPFFARLPHSNVPRRSVLGLPERLATAARECACARDELHAVEETHTFHDAKYATRASARRKQSSAKSSAIPRRCRENDPIAAITFRRTSTGVISATLRALSGSLPITAGVDSDASSDESYSGSKSEGDRGSAGAGAELVIVGDREIVTDARNGITAWGLTKRYMEKRLGMRAAAAAGVTHADAVTTAHTQQHAPGEPLVVRPSRRMWFFVEKISG
eukprot:Opistho-2@66825